MLAWSQLLGTQTSSSPSRPSGLDILSAAQTFKELVDFGLPSAHMVFFRFL